MLVSTVSPSTPCTFLSCGCRFLSRTAASVHNFPAIHSDHFYYPWQSVCPGLCVSGIRAIEISVTGSRKDAEEEEDVARLEFIDVGYISSPHGLKGELRVKPNTGFPELRFCMPGKRWLRSRILGMETISEMQLTGGRNHVGQKCWIISFEGIDTVDKAKQIVGSTFLVRKGDRPELQEDEFYTNDLVGMSVIHKEAGIFVGTVSNVFNFGANDLLHVMRASCDNGKDILVHSDSSLSEIEIGASGQFVWIPFVKAIVPEVNVKRREIIISPPKGLLELNLRSNKKSKKERRRLEWKHRKKLQHRISAAKKTLREMGQSHLLAGLSIGEKGQRDTLAKQIVNTNLRLFRHAVRSIDTSSIRPGLFDFVGSNSDLLLKNALKIPYECLLDYAYPEKYVELFKEGEWLLKNSKAALFLVINDDRSLEAASDEFVHPILEKLLLNLKKFLKFEGKNIEIPLILMASTDQIKSSKQFLLDNDYFGFNAEKFLIIEETKLPVARKSAETYDILLKSPWEILQAPTGSGGTFASLSSHRVVDFLQEMGIEYVQISSLSKACAFGSPLLFGWAITCGADITLKMLEDGEEEAEFDMIFSIGRLSQICKQFEEIPFQAFLEQHEHVGLVDGEWVEIKPTSPNSYRLHCSIYSVLSSCCIGKISLMQVSA